VNEFRDKARPAELGDPATDRPLTYRVHPDDDPRDPNARRAVRLAQRPNGWPWVYVTGPDAGYLIEHADVADWPYTNHALASAAFLPPDPHRTWKRNNTAGTVTCLCGETASVAGSYPAAEWWREHRRQACNATAQAAERGDMDERSFKGGTT
jgi:hypothetical protein